MDSGFGLKNKHEEGKAFTLHHYAKTIFIKAKEFNRRFLLYEYFAPMIGDKKEISIADIGAGMFSTTGNFWNTAKVNLYPSDELADEYMEELKKQGIKPIIPIEKQNMEYLTYSDGFFDIVHCVNALDHCRNPYQAIKEMYRVCKLGGWIYLRHHFNTAKIQKKRGMHQWNMTIAINQDCIFYGELGGFALSECIEGFQNVSKKELASERYNMIVSTLHKI